MLPSCWQGIGIWSLCYPPVLSGSVLPCVNFACGPLASLICWVRSTSFMFWPWVVQYRAIAARSFSIFPCCCWKLIAPGSGMGTPYPLLWLFPTPTHLQAGCLIIPSSLPFSSPGTIGLIGASGSLRPPLSLVLMCCHLYPSAATLCCQWVFWKWLLPDFTEEVEQKYLFPVSDPETYLEHKCPSWISTQEGGQSPHWLQGSCNWTPPSWFPFHLPSFRYPESGTLVHGHFPHPAQSPTSMLGLPSMQIDAPITSFRVTMAFPILVQMPILLVST